MIPRFASEDEKANSFFSMGYVPHQPLFMSKSSSTFIAECPSEDAA
jgi:hypothetical protein